jgi:hypothetical protein
VSSWAFPDASAAWLAASVFAGAFARGVPPPVVVCAPSPLGKTAHNSSVPIRSIHKVYDFLVIAVPRISC